MIGRLAYRVRATFRNGIRAAYWRDIGRSRILNSAPVCDTSDYTCEIHALTSSSDWLNLLWTLKTFYRFSRRRYALCIHEDGSLPESAVSSLLHHFPQCRVIRRCDADRDVFCDLECYRRCTELRRTNTLSIKIFDFLHYLKSDRMLLLDSDILFFAEPGELLRRIDDPEYRRNSVNPDVASAYTVDAEMVRRQFGFELLPLFNSGLGLIHRDSLRIDWIEEFLGLPGILSHFWRIEQTLFALCSFRFGAELLPDEYRVELLPSSGRKCCKHYVGAIRHHMYDTGFPSLVRSGFFVG